MDVRRFLVVLGILVSCIAAPSAQAQEADAERAATDILRSFANQEFKTIWDQKISDWARKNWAKDGFLASMSMSRPQLGKLLTLTVVAREHTNHDASTNYDGDLYAITFRNKYTTGEFYERIVVVKDPDGQYRLSGIYGSPVPDK
jgi:hypothetical protein